jgi:hypothetical protein
LLELQENLLVLLALLQAVPELPQISSVLFNPEFDDGIIVSGQVVADQPRAVVDCE